MLTDTTISGLIAKLGCLDPVPGVGGGDTGYRPLDAGEVAGATLVACGDAVIPELIEATNSDHWDVRCRCADVLGILGSEAGLPALVGLLGDANWHVQQSAMLALLGDSGADLAASYPGVSAFMEFCHRTSRFDILTLLARHGDAEMRPRADTLLKQGSPARRTVLDPALSYTEKKRNLEALRVDVNRVCDEIRRTGTEPERASAAQFLQQWKNESQLGRAGSRPATPAGELVRAAAFNPTPWGSKELVRPSDKPELEPGAALIAFSAPKTGRRLRLAWPGLPLGRRAQRGGVPSALSSSDPEVPAPSLEAYAMRTHARRWLSPVADMEMILIPAGAFLMGDYDRKNNPRRTVSLDAYWISRHPVTVKQYRKFCSERGHALPKAPDWGWKDDHPIVNVSWDDAQAFCDWAGVKLATEAQWEKAARGTEGRMYPWGDGWDASKCANSVNPNNLHGTMPVGSYPLGATPYGVLDMAGNVREWCEDKYDDSGYRVLRGGSWNNFIPNYFRCAFRDWNSPVYRYFNVGFRCVVRADAL